MRFDKLPLLDDDFDVAQLLDNVVNTRRERGFGLVPTHGTARDYLTPETARKIYETSCESDPFTINAVEPDPKFTTLVDSARAQIVSMMPEWLDAFSLPVRIQVVPTSSYFGYSILSRPQHIFLASLDEQFRDPQLLLENYLHEFAHLWLYLMQELRPFETRTHRLVYTLPSGTSGRTVTATMDAAYVAAVLRRYYARVENIPRRRQLTAYVAGCLMQIKDDPDLTGAGLSICRRLAMELTTPTRST